MAIATDDFTGDNGASLGANWTQVDNGWSRSGGKAACVAALEACEHWNESVNNIGDDQYSKAIVSNAGGDYLGVAVRMKASTNAGDGYLFYSLAGTGSFISSQVAGTRTNHQGPLTAFANTDEVEIRVTGQTVKCYIDGVQVGSDQDMSAVNLTGGQPGLFAYGVMLDGTMDDFEGGDLGAGGGTVPPLMFHRKQQGISG